MYKATVRSNHTHSDASMTINGHNIHQNLKRAVERDSQIEPTKFRRPSVSLDNLCAPQSSVMSTNPKKGNPPNFMTLIPPYLLLRNLALTGCENALQSNVVGSLLEVAVSVALETVGGFLSAPKIPFQKLRSDHSLPLPRISPTSITYAESYAH